MRDLNINLLNFHMHVHVDVIMSVKPLAVHITIRFFKT